MKIYRKLKIAVKEEEAKELSDLIKPLRKPYDVKTVPPYTVFSLNYIGWSGPVVQELDEWLKKHVCTVAGITYEGQPESMSSDEDIAGFFKNSDEDIEISGRAKDGWSTFETYTVFSEISGNAGLNAEIRDIVRTYGGSTDVFNVLVYEIHKAVHDKVESYPAVIQAMIRVFDTKVDYGEIAMAYLDTIRFS